MANRTPHRTRFVPILVCLGCCILMPLTARAANSCPWLTEATASSLIGSNSVGSFTAATGMQPAICSFSPKDQALAQLTITVEIAKDPQMRMRAVARSCGANPSALHAIGNEAVYCSSDRHHGEIGERAVGRVRDQVFTIVLISKVKNNPVLTRDALKARLYTAAEQVAGNLF